MLIYFRVAGLLPSFYMIPLSEIVHYLTSTPKAPLLFMGYTAAGLNTGFDGALVAGSDSILVLMYLLISVANMPGFCESYADSLMAWNMLVRAYKVRLLFLALV